jgi:hypothetical protein
MWMTCLILFVAAMPRFAVVYPVMLVEWLTVKSCPGKSKKYGITIMDTNAETREEFTATISSVLDLIHGRDLRRLKRVTREIRVIDRGVMWDYSPLMKINTVDLQHAKNVTSGLPDEYNLQVLACFLIGTATCASLRSRGIPQNRRNSPRIEKLCAVEMVRFARKIGVDEITCEILGKELGPSSFSERVQYVKEGIRRILREGG